ncbi:acyl-CoA N-acyltransferase [Gautieria morchelliformis]|nr:acyl-CoA N-acyltransferase [Gautieria morchelliformis]
MPPASATIRPAMPSDNDDLSRICLLTGDAGSSAEASYSIPELLGLIYALPYNRLETTFGFVLVDTHAPWPDSVNANDTQHVVGYILGTTDSKKFDEAAEREWWPALREKYTKGKSSSRTRADERCISIIHAPSTTPEDISRRFPAYIHIDILPSHQRKSYGSKLMASAVAFLQIRGHTGLFVGLDPANESAKKFYGRLGFERIEAEGGEWWGLDFDKFRR